MLATIVLVLLGGCGYRPLRSGLDGHPHVRIARAIVRAPAGGQVSAGDEAELGARGELAKYGALADADGPDVVRLTLEIVRIDERSEGAMVIDGPSGGKPLARGVRVRVTVRGDLEGQGEPFTTADFDAVEVISASPDDVLGWDAARSAAIRTAARKAGAMVAREVLGLP
jgi:hypothetical protein